MPPKPRAPQPSSREPFFNDNSKITENHRGRQPSESPETPLADAPCRNSCQYVKEHTHLSSAIWPASPHHEAVDIEAVEAWTEAKRWNLEITSDLSRIKNPLAARLRACQSWLRYRPTETGEVALTPEIRRCGKRRLCPICLVAKAKELRPAVDYFSRHTLYGQSEGDLFLGMFGRGNWQQWSNSLARLQDSHKWRDSINGAVFGRHVGPTGATHVHVYCDSEASKEELNDLAVQAMRSVGITHCRIHIEEVRNPGAAIQYLLAPVKLSGIPAEQLVRNFEQLKGKQTFAFTAGFAAPWKKAKKETKRNIHFTQLGKSIDFQWDDETRQYEPTDNAVEHSPY